MITSINKLFPEFKDSHMYHKESENLPYVFVGDFADFAINELNRGNDNFAERIVKFINDAYEKIDEENKNLIWVGFFEEVAGNDKWNKLLSTKLVEPLKSRYIERFC